MRFTAIASAISFALVTGTEAQQASAAVRKHLNIDPQPLELALQTLASDRGFQLMYRADLVGNRQTAGAVGQFTADEALTRLLAGTGLIHRYLDDHTITIVPANTSAPAREPEGRSTQPAGENATHAGPTAAEAGRSSWWRFRLADAGSAGDIDSSTAAPASSPPAAAPLEEVLVSAQKNGEERLQQVPIPISVLNTDALTDRGQVSLRDFFSSVPALVVSPNYGLAQQISIRGISTGGFSNPTVAVLVDDIPFGASTNAGDGTRIPDIDPGDLARIEVLRGPQGTLYGASSLGGLIRYVTKEPRSTAIGTAGVGSLHTIGKGGLPATTCAAR